MHGHQKTASVNAFTIFTLHIFFTFLTRLREFSHIFETYLMKVYVKAFSFVDITVFLHVWTVFHL